MNIPKLLLTALISIILSSSAIKAQELPSDLTAISQADVPMFATYFSIAYWPDYPPLPCNGWDPSGTLYYSPTYGTSYIWVDDRASVAGRMLADSDNPLIPGDDDGGGADDSPPQPYIDWTTNHTDLWLSISYITNVIEGTTNLQAAVVMHNTFSNEMPYEVFSSTNSSVPMSNWVSEGLWIAHSTNTPANINVGDRTNQNFFRARLWNGQFTYGIPKCGELFLLLPDTNAIYAVVNGVTNPISPFYSNWAMARLPATNGNILQTYTFNAGYDGSDSGPTFISGFTQQNIRAFVGFSTTASNVALSYNAITNIDVRNWPNLYDLECWHTTNLLSAQITNCPKLYRVCFESIDPPATNGIRDVIDFTGCTNLADLRAACNDITNIVLGANGGSNIWHFCIRDARNRTPNPVIQGIPFKALPSLKELWVWRDNSYADNIVLTAAQSPKLQSVDAFANFFQSVDFTGQTNLYDIQLQNNKLTNFVVTGCTAITNLTVQDNFLPSTVVDSVLVRLDQSGLTNGSASLDSDSSGNNGVPSSVGLGAIANLLSKGWFVGYNHPDSVMPQMSNLAVSPGSNHATITWTTLNEPSDSTVHYGTTTNYTSVTNDDTLVISHSMTIPGLTTNTVYHFYISSSAGSHTTNSTDNQFTTLGRATNSSAIWFTNNSATVSMQVAVSTGATVTWVWGNGTITTGMTSITTNLGSTSLSNAVVVDPASALLAFGAICGDDPKGNSYSVSNTLLKSVWGLTNYPNLGSLYLLSTYLNDLSLAKCTNLTHLALIHTAPSTNTENAWFHDLATAQVAGKPSCTVIPLCDGTGSCNTFYCPLNPGPTNTASGSDYYELQNSLGWTITPAN